MIERKWIIYTVYIYINLVGLGLFFYSWYFGEQFSYPVYNAVWSCLGKRDFWELDQMAKSINVFPSLTLFPLITLFSVQLDDIRSCHSKMPFKIFLLVLKLFPLSEHFILFLHKATFTIASTIPAIATRRSPWGVWAVLNRVSIWKRERKV